MSDEEGRDDRAMLDDRRDRRTAGVREALVPEGWRSDYVEVIAALKAAGGAIPWSPHIGSAENLEQLEMRLGIDQPLGALRFLLASQLAARVVVDGQELLALTAEPFTIVEAPLPRKDEQDGAYAEHLASFARPRRATRDSAPGRVVGAGQATAEDRA
ncbi:hypothetical protein DSM104299_04242 [Baekduia alba]|uniref:hypothetical protein n=1 Tax=Baekduia alba TaxID=2997333 RepID=UPI002341AACF|nr:hypothetical protein [Baekduia alba]WCB95494.1 hypothetical protein DSM104299_04242 [Baekduia alba]